MANELVIDTSNKELVIINTAEKKERKAAAPRKRSAKKPKVVMTKSRRKRAVARARLKPGLAKITINRADIRTIKPREVREMILEPVTVSSITKGIAASSDISISVRGGGASGQAQAARSALAKAIAVASQSDVVRKQYIAYDRNLLVDDVRQVEPKKYLGPKARARFQKSYR